MHELIEKQALMLKQVVKLQAARDKERLKDNDFNTKTVFPLNSYVLVKSEVPSDNKLTARWLGPYQITKHFERREGDVYRCLHLATNREFDFRVERLNVFLYIDEDLLHNTAPLDKQQYEVKTILRTPFQRSTDRQEPQSRDQMAWIL